MDKTSFLQLGQYLRQKRLAQGLSQVDIAKKLGYKSQFIANWERGASAPPIDALRKLVGLLHIPQKDILSVLHEIQTNYWKRNLFKSSGSKAKTAG